MSEPRKSRFQPSCVHAMTVEDLVNHLQSLGRQYGWNLPVHLLDELESKDEMCVTSVAFKPEWLKGNIGEPDRVVIS